MNITYCPIKGKPHTVEFDDKLKIGLHRKGTQVTLPLGKSDWNLNVMPGFIEVIFTSDDQIDLLIERLTQLKNLKEIYNQPVEEVIL